MPIQQPVTIQDVARAAGVSGTTVSRVLNRQSTQIRVSAATEKRIWEAAAAMGYRPNILARGLRGQKTHVVGCLFADMGDPLLQLVGQATQASARERGYRLLIADAAEGLPTASETPEVFNRALVDGVIILGNLLRSSAAWVQYLTDSHRAVVGFGFHKVPTQLATVNVDNVRGSLLMLEHLYLLGHRRIAYMGCPRNLGMQVRHETFRSFAASRNLDCPDSYVQSAPSLDFADGFATMRKLLETRPRPTAVFAANDRMAMGALCAASQAGVRVPGELSIGGFDDLPFSAYSAPPLTTVHQPTREVGAVAVELLLDIIEGRVNSTEERSVILEPELVVRESTAPPPAD